MELKKQGIRAAEKTVGNYMRVTIIYLGRRMAELYPKKQNRQKLPLLWMPCSCRFVLVDPRRLELLASRVRFPWFS
jgi:hypothetical protein